MLFRLPKRFAVKYKTRQNTTWQFLIQFRWKKLLFHTLFDCSKTAITTITNYTILREYHMGFWLSPVVSNRDAIISPRAVARGLIMVEGWYWGRWPKPCYNLFTTYSNPQFELSSLKNHHFSNQNKAIRPCKSRNVTQYHSTDVILTWRANVTPWHDNLSPFKKHDFRLSARADNQKGGKHIIIYAEFVLSPRI